MHICYLTADYHSSSSGGGIASYLNTISSALTKAGHQVTILTLGRQQRDYFDGAVRVIEIKNRSLHWYLYKGLPVGKSLALAIREIEWSYSLWRNLRKLHQEVPVDVVESGELGVLWRAIEQTMPPLIVRGHGNSYDIKKFSGEKLRLGDRITRKMELAGIKKATAITAVSRFQATQLAEDLQCDIEQIRVIPNPLHEQFLINSNGALTFPARDNEPIILYTGRIEFRKGTLTLLDSIPYVVRHYPKIRFILAGGRHTSIDDNTLSETIAHNHIEPNLTMLGHVPWHELVDWYHSASIFVMPSYYETFGISVIEAMAFGLPIVATTAGALPEVVEDGVTGLLVPPGDPQALATAIIHLLENPELRRQMGQAGQQRVQDEFTVQRVLNQTLSVYRKLLPDDVS